MAKIWTGKTLREVVGVGSVIDTQHEGPTIKRPTEVDARLDKFGRVTTMTPEDFFRKRDERKAAEKAKLAQKPEGER